MKYETLNWESLQFLKTYLYPRLTEPLQKSLETLEQIQQELETGKGKTQLPQTQQNLEALFNTLKAWAALVEYKQAGNTDGLEMSPFTSAKLPAWFKQDLERQTTLRLDFEHTIQVHQETFLEGILLLYYVTRLISSTVHLHLTDAPSSIQGVYVRLIFANPEDRAPFANLGELETYLQQPHIKEREATVLFVAARDMMTLNRAKFTLQNNKKTGQQSLSAFFVAVEDVTEPKRQTVSTGVIAIIEKSEVATPAPVEAKSVEATLPSLTPSTPVEVAASEGQPAPNAEPPTITTTPEAVESSEKSDQGQPSQTNEKRKTATFSW